MRILALSLLAGSLLCSPMLLAQEDSEEVRPVLRYRTAADMMTQTQQHALSRDWHHEQIFACSRKHPLTPRDIEMREAVRKLGANKHRFVRFKLRNGSTVVGGITFVGQESFSVTQGIWGGKLVPYRFLELAPRPDAAIGEHFTNGLKWTGVIAGYAIAVPVVILMMSQAFTGVLPDC